ncbi:cadherin-23-like [Limulus polyphemus]|uniref:Cadherin-23-like n=1 Tax=Limulus polyphemus TaxID=6850 RepID=A0ABM1TEG0_LIMPO|nr:cadherin-23-like [Limulus polyphemus]
MQKSVVLRAAWFLLVFKCCVCVAGANTPPRFALVGVSEIVVRVKEGPESVGTLLYQLTGEDLDGDTLIFGVQGPVGQEILKVEKTGPKQADVFLNKELDREMRDSYSLLLTLTDGRLGEGQYITQPMLIIVEDINDNEPIFKSYSSSLSIREDATPGVIETVEATDRDQGPFGQVIYQLQNTDSDVTDTFAIQTSNGQGVISLVGKLDYERKSLYQLRVLAVDRANSGRRNTATAAILVKVEDVEDQPPVFTIVPPITRIPEDLPLGSSVLTVKAVDGDRGINNDVKYRINKGGNGLFLMDRDSGVVIVKEPLDRESVDNIDNRNGAFILEIEAIEDAPFVYPPPSVITEVTIILTDVNDETPTFRSKSYIAEVNENAQASVPVSFIGNSVPEVFDHDQGTNGTFQLFLEDDNEVFDVTPSEGVNEVSFLIRVKRPTALDYERVKVMNFKVIARETVFVSPKSSSADVTIYIRDTNDNFPEFSKDLYRGSIPENAQKGTTVAVIKAEDRDSGDFGTTGIRFTELRGQIADKLNLDPVTGVITVKTSEHGFDRETTSQYYVTVEARDNNGKGNRNSVQLQILLEDVNDNVPRFLLPRYEARINENEANFLSPLVVQARDDDLNGTKNSEVRYQIIRGDQENNFSIDSVSGEIKPRTPLDFEKIAQGKGDIRTFTLTVQAYDLGLPSLHSDVSVVIYVQDKNDFSPVFQHSFYTKSIPEDTTENTPVVQVLAFDGDHSPSNSRVVYRIQSGAQDKFVIDANSGVISVAQGANLDPDRTSPKTSSYTLQVVALDGGIGEDQRQAVVLVNISITDVNNKAPTLTVPETLRILEDAPLGYHVTKVVASDLDDRPVLRYSFDYSHSEATSEDGALVTSSEYDITGIFDINSVDGSVKVVKKLDREKVETIKLLVRVEDLAAVTPGQTATATLTVVVEDINDNKPVFTKPFYKQAVTENAKIGSPIVTVVATDADKNRTISYSLEGRPEVSGLISINNKTDADFLWVHPEKGEVVVNQKIDREQFSWLNLTVRATDNGVPPLSETASLFLQVLDDNDNNPIFVDGPSQFIIPEDAAVGQLVASVQATDADTGEYGKVTYTWDPSGGDGKFRIDRDTGQIIVAEPLDREKKEIYNLIVQAWDNYEYGFVTGESRKAFRKISIRVTDVNDETPQFIPQQTKRLFDIEPMKDNTARVVSRTSLRMKTGNFTLLLRAQDHGDPPRASTEKFQVCVKDVNDHSPVFFRPLKNFTVRVPENATIGTTITEVKATDEDEGINGEVRYRLKKLPNGHWKTFQISEKSGIMTLRQELDRETQRIYELRVEAFDMGEPTSLSTDLDLKVYVTDVNDYAPEFTQDIDHVTFTENLPAGQEKFKLTATIDKDDDDGVSKPIPCYFIVGGNENGNFRLDIFTHELSTTKTLDREERSNYSLIVQASDDCFHVPPTISHFDPRDNSLLQVQVNVKDVNDNPPYFISPVFTGGLTTEMDFNTVILRVKAVDADIGIHSVVHYYILGKIQLTLSEGLESIKGPPFLLNQKTGEIVLNFDPQRGMKGYFDFQVKVNDTDGLSDTARVFIYLLREDQKVRFVLRLTPEEIRERLERFREVLANITGAIVNVDEYKFHENQDGSVDKKKSDLYLHFVNKEDNTIMEVTTVLSLIDKNIEFLDELFKEFNVLYSEPSQQAILLDGVDDQVRVWLIGLAVFLAIMLVLVISLCLIQRSRYERQLKAATATAFGSQESTINRINIPNTNQHSVEGSNPIWVHAAYDNDWYKDDENLSHRSLDDSLDENAVESPPDTSSSGSPFRPTLGRGFGNPGLRGHIYARPTKPSRPTPQNITVPEPSDASSGQASDTTADSQEQNNLNRTHREDRFRKHVTLLPSSLETSEL